MLQHKTNIIINSVKNECSYCGKTYTRKSSYDRHIIICKMQCKSAIDLKVEEEENTDIPSKAELYSIIKELALKCSHLEERINEMQKWINNKKKKINIINWLNENVRPENNFGSLIDSIIINESFNNNFIENTFIQCVSDIFTYLFIKNKPKCIQCFSQKVNVFYIYDKDIEVEEKREKEDVYIWRIMKNEEFLTFMNNFQRKMMIVFNNWKIENSKKINEDDKWNIIYNKTLGKLVVSFRDTYILNKCKTILFNILKNDMKSIIDYEFEF